MKKVMSCLVMLGVLVVGCAKLNFFDSVILVTEVGDSIRTEYASLYKAGLVTPEQHDKATAADEKYRESLAALASALEVYKLTGEQATVSSKLRIVKDAIKPMLDIVFALGSSKASKLQVDLNRAVAVK